MNPLGAGGTCVTFRAGRSKVSLRSCGADISLRPSGADISGRAGLTDLTGVTLRAGRACVAFGAGRACGACLTGHALVTLRPSWPSDRGAGFSLRASGAGRTSGAGRAVVTFRAGGAGITLRPGFSLCSGGALCARLTLRAGLSNGAGRACGAFRALDAAGVHPGLRINVPPVQMRTDQIGVSVLSCGVGLLQLLQGIVLGLPGHRVAGVALQASQPLFLGAGKAVLDGDLVGGDIVASPGPGIWNVTQSNPSSQASAGRQVCAYQRINSE